MLERCICRNVLQLGKEAGTLRPFLGAAVLPRASIRTVRSPRSSLPAARQFTSVASHTSSIPNSEAIQEDGPSFNDLLADVERITKLERAPTEQEIQRAFTTCEILAGFLKSSFGTTRSNPKTATLDLLGLKEAKGKNLNWFTKSGLKPRAAVNKLSSVAFDLVKAPQIFVTAKHLESYVNIQTFLGRPQTFPAVFDLYASKPVPKANSSPVQYKAANLNAVASAIPLQISSQALDAAILVRDLPLCISIIETSVGTTAFTRSKFIRRALFPITLLSLTPVAAYGVASQVSKYQELVDPQTFTNMATVGFMVYVGFTSMAGYTAITTANDQMERVTWLVGTPLRYRWLREEERAMADRLAMEWGFQDREKRGDEEGRDWQLLRAWTTSRDMVLDKPELLEGME